MITKQDINNIIIKAGLIITSLFCLFIAGQHLYYNLEKQRSQGYHLDHKVSSVLEEKLIGEEYAEEKGLTFLILKEKLGEYKNLEKITGRYPKAAKYIPFIKKAVKENEDIWPIDLVLYLGLVRWESEFKKFAVSRIGASGPAQIEPFTAHNIGKNKGWGVYLPDYYYKARSFNSKADSCATSAYKFLRQLDIKSAENNMKLYFDYKNKANTLFEKYKKELLEKVKNKNEEELIKIHWPFNDSLAIFEGTKYLAYKLKERKGDVREALAAYNAGSYAVKKANGIPSINESVKYQNSIVNFYKHWSKICY